MTSDEHATQRLDTPPPALHPHQAPNVPLPPGYAAYPPQFMMPPGYPLMQSGNAYPPGYGPPLGYFMQPAPAAPAPAVVALSVADPLPAARAQPLHEPAVAAPPKKAHAASQIIAFWRSIGGGSLTLSLVLHGALLLIAGLVVFNSTLTEKNVDFLPGGGTQQGQAASQSLERQVQQKRQKQLTKLQPLKRVVTQSTVASLSLPDAPIETLDLPSKDSFMNAGPMSGGFGSMGHGGGLGNGLGLGSAQGFVSMTVFGKLGGDGLPGVFFDLKQTPDRQPTAYAGAASEDQFAEIINSLAAKRFAPTNMKDFFRSTQQMSFTYLLVPYQSANEGPKAFQVDKEVQPRAWFVHYGGYIQPPAPGDYRFVGFFDDALIVYINHKPVLDGSWYPIVDRTERRKDESVRQDFGGPVVPGTGNRRAYAGKWVKLSSTTRIDIIVGERPGGRVGGMLLVQAKKGKYAERSDGTPVLPVFSTTKMAPGDIQRMKDFAGADNAYEIASDTPVFTLGKPLFND